MAVDYFKFIKNCMNSNSTEIYVIYQQYIEQDV